MALLTLQRREEVAGMKWSEISPDLTTWTIPAGRMKNHKAHDVHLSEPARKILRSIPRTNGCDFVFTTNGRTSSSGFSRAKSVLDARIAERNGGATMPQWHLHDFRRTGVSKLADLGVDSIVADKLLAHKPTRLAGVASVYQRHAFRVNESAPWKHGRSMSRRCGRRVRALTGQLGSFVGWGC